jgi:hypothetical protein
VTRVEIDVPDMASVGACGACSRPLIWLANLDNLRVFAAVVDDHDRTILHLHRCKPLQAPATWKALAAVPAPDQALRNAAGRALAEEALKNKDRTEGDESNAR